MNDASQKECFIEKTSKIFPKIFWCILGLAFLIVIVFCPNCGSDACPFLNNLRTAIICICTIFGLKFVNEATEIYVDKAAPEIQETFYNALCRRVTELIPDLTVWDINEIYVAFGEKAMHYEIRKNCKRHKKFEIRIDFETENKGENIENAKEIRNALAEKYPSCRIEESNGLKNWRRLYVIEKDEDVSVDEAANMLKEIYEITKNIYEIIKNKG